MNLKNARCSDNVSFGSILWGKRKKLFFRRIVRPFWAKKEFLTCSCHLFAPKFWITIPGPPASCSSADFGRSNTCSVLFGKRPVLGRFGPVWNSRSMTFQTLQTLTLALTNRLTKTMTSCASHLNS